jgi:hypothetical protein
VFIQCLLALSLLLEQHAVNCRQLFTYQLQAILGAAPTARQGNNLIVGSVIFQDQGTPTVVDKVD